MAGTNFTVTSIGAYTKKVQPESSESLKLYIDSELSSIQYVFKVLSTTVNRLQTIFTSSYNWVAKQWFLAGIDVTGDCTVSGNITGNKLTAPTGVITKVVTLTPTSTVPSPAVQGMIYFDSSLAKFRGYTGALWVDL